MNIRRSILMDQLDRMLRKFTRDANKLGASPDDVIDALALQSSAIYAVELSGAKTKRELNAAKDAWLRGAKAGLVDLPLGDVDLSIEARLADDSHGTITREGGKWEIL